VSIVVLSSEAPWAMARNEANDMMIVAERSVSEVRLPLTLIIVIMTIL
jgi:hypothetical protein